MAPAAKIGKPNSEGGAAFAVGVNANGSNNTCDVEYITPQKKLSKDAAASRTVLKPIDNIINMRGARTENFRLPEFVSVTREPKLQGWLLPS